MVQSKLAVATVVKNFNIKLHENTRYPLIMDNENVGVKALGDMNVIVNKI